jgi:hypothetical protein
MALRLSKKVLDRIKARRAAEEKWREFVDWTRTKPSPRWVFRGQSEHWPLRPLIGRIDRYRPEIEIQLLREFRRLALPHLGQTPFVSIWDWLFLAQHHGLPTRLIDWTTNPLVAAFFASQPSPRNRKAGEIIAVEPRRHGFVRSDESAAPDPFAIIRNQFVYPSALAKRIATQRGLFSVHAKPQNPWRLRNQTDRFVIPASVKPNFRRLLHDLGVDAHFLMADLDGLTATLKWRFASGIPFE